MTEADDDGVVYGDAEKQRLWAHRLHEDAMLSDRQNFFLVAQSLLVVAQADLLGDGETLAAAILDVAGLLLTATWLYVVLRQRAILRYVQGRAREHLPEFDDTYKARPAGPSSTAVYVTAVPSLLGAAWVLFLIIALV
jgi:hypothetical protein